jgi:hypothetical protein
MHSTHILYGVFTSYYFLELSRGRGGGGDEGKFHSYPSHLQSPTDEREPGTGGRNEDDERIGLPMQEPATQTNVDARTSASPTDVGDADEVAQPMPTDRQKTLDVSRLTSSKTRTKTVKIRPVPHIPYGNIGRHIVKRVRSYTLAVYYAQTLCSWSIPRPCTSARLCPSVTCILWSSVIILAMSHL